MDMDETASILASIPGGKELLNWFGKKPNFGDAEVLSLNLNRDGPSTLCVGVYKEVKSSHQAIIGTFTLCDMIDIALEGFGHQNVIEGLTIRGATKRSIHKSLVGISNHLQLMCLSLSRAPGHLVEFMQL